MAKKQQEREKLQNQNEDMEETRVLRKKSLKELIAPS